jgi:quinol-cytochrome oxidoreductase complex cytochrome b subunit
LLTIFNTDKTPFHPYFTVKDIVGFAITITILSVLTLKEPYILRDPDSFTPANPLVTPVLFFTVLLGIYFTALQAHEYIEAPFTIADSAYGSTFFTADFSYRM